MSCLMKPRKILSIHKISIAVQSYAIRKSHWYPDYVPGPYPKTKKEREEAAKKYNLLPEEYEPYESGYGDYPRLPYKSVDSKDPWYPWDFPELKKDFNEPVHIDIIHLLPEGISTAPGSSFKDYLNGTVVFFKIIAGMLFLIYIIQKFVYVYPRSEKQYPDSDVVHYTFELSQENKMKIKDPACDEK